MRVMSYRHIKTAGGLILLLAILTIMPGLIDGASAMPPHPDLLEDHQSGEKALPEFATRSKAEKESMGLDSPSPILKVSKATISGNLKALVVLVEFPDHASSSNPEVFDTLIFHPSQISVKNYYDVMSSSALSIDSVDAPSSLGWVTAPQNYTYYAGGDGGTGTYPNNSQGLCEDVVDLLDPTIDFSEYDGNGDSYVDILVIVHSGTGGESSGDANDIWSHKWGIWPMKSADGVNIYEYCIVPELWFTAGDITCGVYCHEIGHILGLPDLYDTDNSSYGVGKWSLMASGSWLGPGGYGGVPAALDAWSRLELGFNTYTNITSNQNGVSISGVISGGPIYRLWSSGGLGSEFYLVVNRRKVSYDMYLPGEGLLIWHIDDAETNNRNEWYPGHTSSGNYWVALEQADGNFNLEKKLSVGDNSDPYPGAGSVTSFSPSTVPNSNAYNGDNTYVAVTNISAAGATMTADFQVSLLSDIEDDNNRNLPIEFILDQNFPNPFNPSTEIVFELSRASNVNLCIYNLLGQQVTTLAEGQFPAGIHQAVWDGRDESGKTMSSGMYMYELITDFGSDSKKMLLLK